MGREILRHIRLNVIWEKTLQKFRSEKGRGVQLISKARSGGNGIGHAGGKHF